MSTNADRDETKQTIIGNIVNLQMKNDELEFYHNGFIRVFLIIL